MTVPAPHLRSFTPPAASFRMTGLHFFCLHILLSDICAGNLQVTLSRASSLHTSRLPNRHLRRGTSSYALSGISPAHISRKDGAAGPDIATPYKPLIINIMPLKQMDSPLRKQVTVHYVHLQYIESQQDNKQIHDSCEPLI